MNNQTKEDSENLLTQVITVAGELLAKNKEIYPIGAVLKEDNQIEFLEAYDGNEFPESQIVIDNINKVLIDGAKNKEYIATALVYMTTSKDPKTGESFDALNVQIDHKDNYSFVAIFPYIFSDSTLDFGEPLFYQGEYKIFAP